MFFIYRQLTNAHRGSIRLPQRWAHYMNTIMKPKLSPRMLSMIMYDLSYIHESSLQPLSCLLHVSVIRQRWFGVPVTHVERERPYTSHAFVTAYPCNCMDSYRLVCEECMCVKGVWGNRTSYNLGGQNSKSDTLLHLFPPYCIISKLGWPGISQFQLQVLGSGAYVQAKLLCGAWDSKVSS